MVRFFKILDPKYFQVFRILCLKLWGFQDFFPKMFRLLEFLPNIFRFSVPWLENPDKQAWLEPEFLCFSPRQFIFIFLISRSLTSGIITETRVLQEVLLIPNAEVKLVYHSGRARGYLSTIELRLTPEVIPATLKAIQLRITIEGVLFEKTFEADPNLKYTFSWKRMNIYKQRVYGKKSKFNF